MNARELRKLPQEGMGTHAEFKDSPGSRGRQGNLNGKEEEQRELQAREPPGFQGDSVRAGHSPSCLEGEQQEPAESSV